jgi:hypothetical protein
MIEVITWDKDDIKGTIEELDNLTHAERIRADIDTIDIDEIKTGHALTLCKFNLMGEYHGILVRRREETLVDSEIYVLTWDGEASDGGNMRKLDYFTLREIALHQYSKGDSAD